MRKPIIAGNWKMFKTARTSLEFMEELQGKADFTMVDTILCAPFTSLPALTAATKGTGLKIGAQNLHWEDEGAFTGEISGAMLTELGVEYVIIGHSERRAYFAETDETVNKKVHAAFKHGLIPIVCVGEKLEERENGQTKKVCKTQITSALGGLAGRQVSQVIVAYEPIWAIGTGKSSTAEDANEVIGHIRSSITAAYGPETADAVRIQYGGSVKPENIREFMRQPEIDGALVGGASLNPQSFIQLLKGVK